MKTLIVLTHVFFLALFLFNPKIETHKSLNKVSLHLKYRGQKNLSVKKTPIALSPASKPPQKVIEKKTKPPASLPKPQAVKKESPKKIVKKAPSQSENSHSKPLILAYEKETIAKIEEKIDKLEQITKGELKQDNPSIPADYERGEEVIFSSADVALYLFDLLELPGPGKVTVELFLDKVGKISAVHILESENTENSQYLLKSLKDIALPFEKKSQIPPNLKICFSNLQA